MHYADGPGEAGTRNSIIVEYELVQLGKALEQDRYRSEAATRWGGYHKTAAVVDFLSQFSDAFPNWQKEYELLNKILCK